VTVTATKAKTSPEGEHHGEHHVHVVEARVFLNVLVALLILTLITVAVSRVDFGGGNMIIAMAVAIMKASLVMAVFMHLRWDTPINNIFFLGSFVLLALLFLFSFADGFARDELQPRNNRTAPVAPSVYQKAGSVEKEFFDHLEALRGK
jgi:cytochrome c oxidase subunit IV